MKSFIACVFMLVVNCEASVATTTTTSAPVTVAATESAVRDITTARCDRQRSCGNIGQDHTWADVSSCTADRRKATRDILIGKACASGVDAASLSSCINDIRNEPCGAPLSMGEHFASCGNTNLCR